MGFRQSQVDLWIKVEDDWRAADTIQVYTDFGSGTIDEDKPLLAVRAAIFPEDFRDRVWSGGYGDNPSGEVPYGEAGATASYDEGYGADPYGDVPYGETERKIKIPVAVESAYGTWKFAARVYDGAGNPQGALVEFSQFMSGENPPPLASFAYSSYDSGTDIVSFSFSV